MKKCFALVFCWFFIADTFASTVASRFAEEEYACKNSLEKVHIIVKKEHTTDYNQIICNDNIQAITYGYGDLKVKGRKKIRISYICLLDVNRKPFWSYIIPTK